MGYTPLPNMLPYTTVLFQDSEAFIPDVTESVIADVKITTLTNRQFCVILNPMGEDGKNLLGQRRLVKVLVNALRCARYVKALSCARDFKVFEKNCKLFPHFTPSKETVYCFLR